MKKIFVNDNPWQTRVAITREGRLENVYFAAHAQQTLERSYFKGIVSKVLPGIQTAFVDIGQEKAGFLHISEIDHELAIDRISKTTAIDDDAAPKKARPHPRQKMDIAQILKEGDPILVQVSKEPVYEKGAKLTTCFTLPGRFVVLMPNIPRIGISKKIDDRDERTRLKEIVQSYVPEGLGGIIRTTSDGRTAQEIQKDLDYLLRTWQTIQQKFKDAKPQERLYEDLDLPMQVVRDHLDDDVEDVIVDGEDIHSQIYRFTKNIAAEHSHKIKLYKEKTNMFDFYGLEKQIEQALEKKADLKSGGSLIIQTTEAMTVVDVNTGRFTGKSNMEATILKTNLEAAEETVRQLRLRNIGGLIVIDFIDMASGTNRQKLIRHFQKSLRERDKFQSVVLKISEFGLVQMTRKRSGKTLRQQLTETCAPCKGYGSIHSLQTECYALLGKIKHDLITKKFSAQITIRLAPNMFKYVSDTEYNAILGLEKLGITKITLTGDKNLNLGQYKIEKK